MPHSANVMDFLKKLCSSCLNMNLRLQNNLLQKLFMFNFNVPWHSIKVGGCFRIHNLNK